MPRVSRSFWHTVWDSDSSAGASLITHGYLDGFMVAAPDSAAGPVIETTDCGPDYVLGNVGIF